MPTKILKPVHDLQTMMISSEMHDRLHLNHLSQKPQLTLSDLNGKMTLSTYQTMINSLFNVHFSSKNHQVLTFTLHLSLFQYCIELKLQQITFYFARAYLDNVIKNRHQLLILNVKLTCICCVWIAIKFNQQTRFSSYFTAQVMVSHGEATFINSQLIEMEKDICQLLNFKFGYTIPLAYAQTFFQSFPTFAYIKKVLYVLSDFTISITGLGWESAENLFYGIFIAALRIKKIKMNHSQISLFKQKVSKIQKILYIAQTISKAYISALESQDKLLNEPENDILLMLS